VTSTPCDPADLDAVEGDLRTGVDDEARPVGDHHEFGLLDEVSAVLFGHRHTEEHDDRHQRRSCQPVWRSKASLGD